MPTVPLDQLHGVHAYSLQGFMRAQNLGSQTYIVPPTGTVIRVGLGKTRNFKSKEWPKPPKVGELPVMTAFYPSQYPPPPSPPPSGAQPPPPLPAAPAYTPNVGYYPFAESGVMMFEKGAVHGVIRVNTTGWAAADPSSFQGWYRFDSLKPSVGLPMGVITIQLDDLKNHIWDYAFVMMSRTEILLATGGRLPRPAVGTGTMRPIAPGLLKWF